MPPKGPPLSVGLPQIRALIASDRPMRDIADELGISRQRLYQICRTHKIDFKRYRHQREDSASAKQAKEGISSYTATHMKGTAAEMMVAATLILRCWNVYIPLNRGRSHDLIAVMGERVITVEVRTATREKATGKAICTRDRKSDVLAVVCDGEITFEPSL
jgi:hypothetical protein